MILEFVSKTKDNQFFELRRHEQDQFWMHETLKELILADFFEDETHQEAISNLEKQVVNGEISSFAAAEKLYRQFKNKS